MTRQLIIRAEAESDLEEACDWYEARMPGLSTAFLASLDEALQAVSRNPLQYPIVYKKCHRILIRRFPYQVFFCVEKSHIIVLAVFSTKRDPKNLGKRL